MTLELDLGPDAGRFRDELRRGSRRTPPRTLSASTPSAPPPSATSPELRPWTTKLHEAGYLCVAWPTEFGGRGLTGVELAVMNEEFARAGVPRMTRGMGEWLVGPSIIVWGTDEQKAHFLPRIIEGTDRYCQGFLRARRRIGPRRRSTTRGHRRRRRGRHHRPEGVDLGRAAGEHDVLPVPDGSRRLQAPRHLLRARPRCPGRTARRTASSFAPSSR